MGMDSRSGRKRWKLHFAGVVGPVEQGLALARAAVLVAGLAKRLYLPHVASHVAPAFDLPCVFVWNASTQIVPAIPLEPAARIFFVHPAFANPLRPALAGVNTKVVKRRVVFVTKFRLREPSFGEFTLLAFKVMCTKHAQLEHLLRRQLWCEIGVELFAFWCLQVVFVILQRIVHGYMFHAS